MPTVPTPTELAVRYAKMAVYRGLRLARWVLEPARFPRCELAPELGFPHLAHQVSVPVLRLDPDAHPALEAGKRRNVALAAPYFDGLLITPDRPLSFWRALGAINAARGFRSGMEVRGGCLVPSLGGGLCLLSNALFEVAVYSGWQIIERHGHTAQAVPEAAGRPWGLDATVLWPYVDLRVAPRSGRARLSVRVREGRLEVQAHTDTEPTERFEVISCQERTEGDIRTNRLIRRRYSLETGAFLGEDEVGVNRKRLLPSALRRRNCLTCNETGCSAREAHLRQVV